MAISETLTRYVGPLPVWGWVVVGGGGFYLIKKMKGSTGLTSLLGSSSGTGADATAAVTSGTTAADVAGASPTDNSSWASDAIQYLESEGYSSSQAQAAIGTYTSGGTVDPSMATLVDNAVQGVGQPPQVVFPTSANPSLPTTAQTSAGAGTPVGSTGTSTLPSYVAQHQNAYNANGAVYATGGPKDSSGHQAYFKYTVKSGDTQKKLASMFGTSATQIEAWNKFKTGQSIKAGQSIWV